MIFGPKIIEERDSEYSGKLKVVSIFGYKYIGTGVLTQSGGLVKDVWVDVLKKFGQKNSSWLVLGLAGGTIAKIVSDTLHPSRIVGVEIDPVMVELGKKYLDLQKIPQLEIVVADAHKYLQRSTEKFDFILVDMYLQDQLPKFVYSLGFLKKLKSLGKTVIFNHLFYDDSKKQLAGELVNQLEQIFPQVAISRKLTNVLIVCQSAD